MYVTGGQYKGHKIIIPECAKPTLSKTRESVFNILFSLLGNFDNLLFLDLYGGTGIMSLEALSRGFKTITIDNNKKAIAAIKENLKKAEQEHEIILKDSIKYIKETKIKPDVIYADPPWDYDYETILKEITKKFQNCILIFEYDKKRAQEFERFYAQKTVPFREKVYGRCKLDFIKI